MQNRHNKGLSSSWSWGTGLTGSGQDNKQQYLTQGHEEQVETVKVDRDNLVGTNKVRAMEPDFKIKQEVRLMGLQLNNSGVGSSNPTVCTFKRNTKPYLVSMSGSTPFWCMNVFVQGWTIGQWKVLCNVFTCYTLTCFFNLISLFYE